jgi:hypothetical protein
MPRLTSSWGARKRDRRRVRRGDQRARDNGKEGEAFDERARLAGTRNP